MNMTNEQVQAHIQALLRERKAVELYGDESQLVEIDAQLELYGKRGKAPARRSTKMQKEKTEL